MEIKELKAKLMECLRMCDEYEMEEKGEDEPVESLEELKMKAKEPPKKKP